MRNLPDYIIKHNARVNECRYVMARNIQFHSGIHTVRHTDPRSSKYGKRGRNQYNAKAKAMMSRSFLDAADWRNRKCPRNRCNWGRRGRPSVLALMALAEAVGGEG